MNTRSLLAFALALSLLSSVFAQQQRQPSGSRTTGAQDDEVVKITTNLVQIDAVVTDKSGKIITDLAPGDFQILEDGRPQPITNFSFVETNSPNTGTAPPVSNATAERAKEKSGGIPAPVPPIKLRPEQVRRTIALVVDDLGLSFESTHFVRNALRKFVDTQMQPGDLVAIIRTGAGVGALQQFTADKQLLYAAIERVKWNARGRAGLAAFAAIQDDILYNLRNRPNFTSEGGAPAKQDESTKRSGERDAENKINDFREELYSVGTLGAINFVIRGLKDLPGRKSVVLMSDGISLFNSENQSNSRTLESMRRLTDLANRASVVVYTLDARGIPILLPGAADNVTGVKRGSGSTTQSGLSGPAMSNQINENALAYFESQGGLSYLAQQTGGFFVHDNNDINLGLKRVLDDQKGFYLIGYRPDESTFDPKTGRKRFHNITVRVTRPGLSVRTRTGFFGISDEEAHPAAGRTRMQQLLSAITSPFASGDVTLRLTSLFLNDPAYGPFMRSLIYVDAKSLHFSEEADGSHKANVDVVAMTFGDDGMVVDQRTRTEAVTVRGAEFEQALRNGLIFGINLPIKKAGAYQLRVAVRDAVTERVGSASQYIEVPDLKKNRLTVSGIYLASNQRAQSLSRTGAQTTPASAEAEGSLGESDPQTGPAVRRFRAGSVIDYGFEIYNAKLEKGSGRPQLQTQVRLFRDNQEVYAGKVIPITGEAADDKRVVAIGHLQLGSNLAPGEYILQVVVTDLLGKEKQKITQQWIDFEIR
jgi:VWFA-related protein